MLFDLQIKEKKYFRALFFLVNMRKRAVRFFLCVCWLQIFIERTPFFHSSTVWISTLDHNFNTHYISRSLPVTVVEKFVWESKRKKKNDFVALRVIFIFFYCSHIFPFNVLFFDISTMYRCWMERRRFPKKLWAQRKKEKANSENNSKA